MRRKAILASVVVMVASAAVSAPATATTLSASAAAAVNTAETQAAALPAPQTADDVRAQATQIQPAVDQVNAQGQDAIAQLLKDDGVAIPAVALAVVNDLPLIPEYSTAPSAPDPPDDPLGTTTTASLAPINTACFGANNSVWNGLSVGVGGVGGWVHIISHGWCGNGTKITYFGGFYFQSGLAPGLCWSKFNTDPGGWITFWSWVHGGVWVTAGAGFKGACVPNIVSGSGAATIREAANGHWDRRY